MRDGGGGGGPWLERFGQFVARKEREAAAADLCAYKTEVDQHDADAEPIGNAWSSRLFDGPLYESPSHDLDVPTTNLVFVRSRDGNTGARNPTLLGGGDTDKHLIYEGLSRVAADAVLSGAETIRGGHFMFSTWLPELVALRGSKGLPRHPVQIVATLRGIELEDALIFNVPELRVVLLTVPQCSAAMRHALATRPWITPVAMSDARDLAGGFRQLRRLGVERISCVGGRTLARQLLDARLIQDLYLTTAAKTGGEPNTPLHPTPLKGNLVVKKHGTGRDEGVTFEHFTL